MIAGTMAPCSPPPLDPPLSLWAQLIFSGNFFVYGPISTSLSGIFFHSSRVRKCKRRKEQTDERVRLEWYTC